MADRNEIGGNPQGAPEGSLRVERSQRTLRERATDNLRKAIIDHRFPPGTHLKERELCDLLGVSRTSVREALRHLESEQLIKTVPHKGPVVVSLTVRDAQDLYQVRASLEGLAGELFAANASDAHIDALCQAADEMESAVRTGDPETTLGYINKFYQVLFDGSHNQVCAQFIQLLNTRISNFRRMTLSHGSRSEAMMKEVGDIVDAAIARDATRLKQACIAHVQGACAALMPQLTAHEEEPPETGSSQETKTIGNKGERYVETQRT